MPIDEIKSKALPILLQAGVTRSSIFGSEARRTARDDSDIDMLIELPPGKNLLDFIDIKLRLEKVLERKVDLVTYRGLKPRLKERILRDQVSIL